jgi:hypothetical protein
MELLPAPGVHADLAAPSALATPNDQRAAALIGLGEDERFPDAQPSAPQDHHHPRSRWPCAASPAAHDGDDLIDLWRIGRIAQTLVARRSTSVKAGHRRRRSTPTGAAD